MPNATGYVGSKDVDDGDPLSCETCLSEMQQINELFLVLLAGEAQHCGGRDPHARKATSEGSLPRMILRRAATPAQQSNWDL